MTLHRFEHIHSRQAGYIETRQPHIHDNRNFQGVVIRLELTLHFLLVLRAAAYFEPLFRILVPHCHHYADLFAPFGTKLHEAVVDFHRDWTAISNNKGFSGKNIGTILFVVIDDIGAERINHLGRVENRIQTT